MTLLAVTQVWHRNIGPILREQSTDTILSGAVAFRAREPSCAASLLPREANRIRARISQSIRAENRYEAAGLNGAVGARVAA